MRSLAPLAALAALALVVAPGAAAALDARLAIDSARLATGEQATIEIRPFWPFAGGRESPADVAYPFRVQALGPGGRNVTFPARRKDRFIYTARFRFSAAGRWEIRLANFYSSAREARLAIGYRGLRLVVSVRRKAAVSDMSG